jgi:hypothetical protein
MSRMIGLWACLLLILTAGCSAMKPGDFANSEPVLDLFAYFEGNTRAWGIFQSRSGEVKRQFTVDIQGTVDGDVLTLEEDFVYADGETSRRVWRIRRLDEHRYEGEAEDVVGKAAGVSYGQALNWRYRLRLPFRESSLEVDFDDWMLLQPDGVLINRAEVRKFGFRVGEVTLFFRRQA